MSDKKIEKSKNLLKKVAEKITKVNVIVDEYNKMAITPAMPGNAFINIANAMYTKGFYNEAENMLQSAICFPTKTSNALINLGIIRQANANYDEAIQYYSAAFEQDHENVRSLGLWGNCLAMKGLIDEAIEKYKQAIEIDEKNADIYLSWGALLIKNKQYNEAKEKLEKAIEFNQKDARPMYMLAIVQIELEEYDEALAKLLKIVMNTENNFEALHNIAYIYFKKKNYDKAISYAKKVLAIFRHKVETYLLLGDIYAIKNQEEESIQFYQMAEMNGIKTFFLYLSWAVSLQKFNRHEEAIDKLNKSNECLKNKNVDEVYARLALSYYKVGNIDMALKSKDKALEINSNNYMANSVAAEIEVGNKNYDAALQFLEKCKDDFSNKGFNYMLRAQCKIGMGQTSGVKELFEKANEYMPDKKEILMAYTKFLIDNGDYETAKKKFKVFADSSDDIEVLDRYFTILYNLAKKGGYKYNIEHAIEIAKKAETINMDKDKYTKEIEELEGILRNYE